MRTGLLAVLALAPVVLSTGCMYRARVNEQLMERELRLEEDCIYRLKWQLEDSQRELEAAKAQLDTLQKQSDVLRERGNSGPDLSSPLTPSGGNSGGSGGSAPRLPPPPRLPSVEPGIEAPSSGGSGMKSSAAPKKFEDSSVAQAAGFTTLDKSSLRPAERMNPDATVERILINPGLTGGLNTNGQADSEMLSVVVEQRDAKDARVLAPGDMSIAVIDPALSGKESRIARWNFDSDEVVQHVRRNHDGGSLCFDLPWPTPPQHSDLRLYVRFTTYDGRRLEANLPIEVQLADDGPGKWRKSKVSLAGNDDDGSSDSGNSTSGGRAAKLRSVYQPDDADNSDSSDTPPSKGKRAAPGWQPYR